MNVQSQADNGNESLRVQPGKYLSFFLGDEEYGFEILNVQEIIRMLDITPVPRTPDFFKGVINLRGRIVPVIDLRVRFGMEECEYTEETCIITVQINQDGRGLMMGVIVDRVNEVVDLLQDQLEGSPAFGMGINAQYILGLGKLDRNVVILLDVDRVLDAEEISLLGKVSETATHKKEVEE